MGDSIFKPYDLQISLQNRPLPPVYNDRSGFGVGSLFFIIVNGDWRGRAHFPSAEEGIAIFDQKTTFDQKIQFTMENYAICVEK